MQYKGPQNFTSFINFMAGQEIILDSDQNILWQTADGKDIIIKKNGWIIRRGASFEAYSNKAIEKYFIRI